MSHPLCYTIRMMIKEAIYKVTVLSTEADTRTEFVKARDEDHAARIVHSMVRGEFINAPSLQIEFACEDCE